MRDTRGAIAYVAIVAAAIRFVTAHARHASDVRDLGLVIAFAVISFFLWELCFGIYRYGVVLEMLTGVIAVGSLLWIVENGPLRIGIAVASLLLAAATTIYPDWGHRTYTDRYIDVHVPQLPRNSIVLVATWEPVAYFIPYADPNTRFIGLENNYLTISQTNGLASEVKQLMRAPGPAKFVLNVAEFESAEAQRSAQALRTEAVGLAVSADPIEPRGPRAQPLSDQSIDRRYQHGQVFHPHLVLLHAISGRAVGFVSFQRLTRPSRRLDSRRANSKVT